jgi:hypothetical protein
MYLLKENIIKTDIKSYLFFSNKYRIYEFIETK